MDIINEFLQSKNCSCMYLAGTAYQHNKITGCGLSSQSTGVTARATSRTSKIMSQNTNALFLMSVSRFFLLSKLLAYFIGGDLINLQTPLYNTTFLTRADCNCNKM